MAARYDKSRASQLPAGRLNRSDEPRGGQPQAEAAVSVPLAPGPEGRKPSDEPADSRKLIVFLP
jgi:hypothetical protein